RPRGPQRGRAGSGEGPRHLRRRRPQGLRLFPPAGLTKPVLEARSSFPRKRESRFLPFFAVLPFLRVLGAKPTLFFAREDAKEGRTSGIPACAGMTSGG